MIGLKFSFFTILSILRGLDLTNNQTIVKHINSCFNLYCTISILYVSFVLLLKNSKNVYDYFKPDLKI